MNEYTSQILDYSQNPPNFGKLEECKYILSADNPSCGDNLTIYIKEKNGEIIDTSFVAEGCAISKAATSMLLESLIGQPVLLLRNIKREDILDLLGIHISSTREKCAFLILDALKNMPNE